MCTSGQHFTGIGFTDGPVQWHTSELHVFGGQAREREVKGLVEALQVTPPRPSSTDYLGVYAVTASYPSSQAMRALSAGAASECIWALAVLGGAAVYEPETDGLIQVCLSESLCDLLVSWAVLTPQRHCLPCICTCEAFRCEEFNIQYSVLCLLPRC